MKLWHINKDSLSEIRKTPLDQEERLEEWIDREPSLLGLDLLLLGRQVTTPFGGRIDLLAINEEAELIIIELKREKTPRDIIAQVLDYASWEQTLGMNELEEISIKYRQESLSSLYSSHFNTSLPADVNTAHGMVIVASDLDEASERHDRTFIYDGKHLRSFKEIDGIETFNIYPVAGGNDFRPEVRRFLNPGSIEAKESVIVLQGQSSEFAAALGFEQSHDCFGLPWEYVFSCRPLLWNT